MTELDKLLTQDTKGLNDADNSLAKIVRGLLVDMDISPIQMIQLLNAWLSKFRRNGEPLDGNERSNRRGNLIKEISRDSLTWNVFEKAIAVLDFDEWEISFKGSKNGRTYKRTVKRQIRTPQELTQLINDIRHGEYIEEQALAERQKQLDQTAQPTPVNTGVVGKLSDWMTRNINRNNF